MSTCAYQPRSRRPIARAFRQTAQRAVRFCVRWRIPPDAISHASMVPSALAGLCFWRASTRPWLLIIAPGFCYVRLWLNMLDGMVAVASHRASERGEIANDLPDRISDILVFAGVAQSGLAHPFSGYWAAILAVLTAYVGVLGQAVGAHREFSGVMAKPWRMVALHAGAWTAAAVGFQAGDAGTRLGSLTVLDWTCLVIVVGCVETIAVRLSRVVRALPARFTGGMP